MLSGGQAPGGHNVIAGLLDGLVAAHPDSKLFGFLAGPGGILRGETMELTPDKVLPYRNTGGFDIIGSGRDKIESDQQLQAAMNSCTELKLDGLVVIGGAGVSAEAGRVLPDPVPFAIHGPGVRSHRKGGFTEVGARDAGFEVDQAHELLDFLLHLGS